MMMAVALKSVKIEITLHPNDYSTTTFSEHSSYTRNYCRAAVLMKLICHIIYPNILLHHVHAAYCAARYR